jgi:hypothetical protein
MNQYEWYTLFLEEYLKDLEAEKASRDISDRLEEWLKKNEWDIWKKPQQPANTCPKCGLKLEGVMGYCCPNAGCPTGLGPVMCSVAK